MGSRYLCSTRKHLAGAAMKVLIVTAVPLLGLALAGKNGKDEACGMDPMTMGALSVALPWELRWKLLLLTAIVDQQRREEQGNQREKEKEREEKEERKTNVQILKTSSLKLMPKLQITNASWRRWSGWTMTATCCKMFTPQTWLLSTLLSLKKLINKKLMIVPPR